MDSRARITIESKDDMRKRMLPSPDGADMAVMLFSGRGQATLFDWASDVQQMIAEDDLITGTLLTAAPTAPQCWTIRHWTQRGFLRGHDLVRRRRHDRRELATRTVT